MHSMVLSEVGQRPVGDLSISTPSGAPFNEKPDFGKHLWLRFSLVFLFVKIEVRRENQAILIFSFNK